MMRAVRHAQTLDLRRWGAAIAAAAAVAATWPTIAGVFLFDDAPVVRDNALVAAGRVAGFFGGNLFGASDGDFLFRPLWLMSLWIDRALFGLHAAPMHAVNVALHALAAALVYRVARRLTADEGEPRRALACALLFAVHPVHLDAVAFLTNRSEILALVFVLLAVDVLLRDDAWRAWLRGEAATQVSAAPSSRSLAINLLGAAALFAALLCKETAAGALAVLFVVVLVRAAQRRGAGQRLRPPPSVLAGLAALAVAFAAYLALRRHALGAVGGDAAAAWIADRRPGVLVPTVARIFADYVRLVVVPWPLRVDYSDFAVSTSPFEPRALAAYALHAVVLAAGLLLVRRRPNAALALFGFYAALLPVSHLVPFREIEAERFLYLPSALACGALLLVPARRAVWLVIALYGLVCFAEATHFRSAEALWTTMAERAPGNAKIQYNLGTTWFEAGRYDLAVPPLEAAVRLEPAYAHAWTNLGECYVAVGNAAAAGHALETAARLDGQSPRAWRNLAAFRALHGDRDGARDALGRARRLAPDARRDAELERLIDARGRP